MHLYLLRHGLAVEAGSPGYARDADRPLTPKGRCKLKDIALAMDCLELSFDLILSSPYLRARQTAELVAEELESGRRLELCDALTPGGSPRKLVDFIQHLERAPKELLLVGHEPSLSELISLLISGHTDLSITLKKGGLCKLAIQSLQPSRCAVLEWLLTPGQMRGIAG